MDVRAGLVVEEQSRVLGATLNRGYWTLAITMAPEKTTDVILSIDLELLISIHYLQPVLRKSHPRPMGLTKHTIILAE